MIRTVWRAWAVVLGAAVLATSAACRPKPASVEELYTTRTLGQSYLQRNQLPEAEAEFKKLTKLAPDDPAGYVTLASPIFRPVDMLTRRHSCSVPAS